MVSTALRAHVHEVALSPFLTAAFSIETKTDRLVIRGASIATLRRFVELLLLVAVVSLAILLALTPALGYVTNKPEGTRLQGGSGRPRICYQMDGPRDFHDGGGLYAHRDDGLENGGNMQRENPENGYATKSGRS